MDYFWCIKIWISWSIWKLNLISCLIGFECSIRGRDIEEWIVEEAGMEGMEGAETVVGVD